MYFSLLLYLKIHFFLKNNSSKCHIHYTYMVTTFANVFCVFPRLQCYLLSWNLLAIIPQLCVKHGINIKIKILKKHKLTITSFFNDLYCFQTPFLQRLNFLFLNDNNFLNYFLISYNMHIKICMYDIFRQKLSKRAKMHRSTANH